MMAAGGEKSIKEITECSICLDTYKNPKGLPCLHTFCCQCLEKFCEDIGGNRQKPACPLCRKAFVIPPGGIQDLPNNFMMNSLMLANPSIRKAEITDKTTFCELCLVMDVNTAAAAYCAECDQHICERHLSSHNNKKQSKSHKILMFDEDDELCESFEKQVRSEVLKNNIKKIEISTLESGKRIKLIKDVKSSLIATVEATRKSITEKYNQVLALINSHHILLKDNLDIFEEKKLTEIEQTKDEEETRFQTLESFNSYLGEMENKENAEDADANDLYSKTEEFVILHCLTPLAEPNGINMAFVPSPFTADGVENLIGVLSFPESSVWSGGQYQGQGMAGFSYPTTSSIYYPSMPYMPPPPCGPGFGMSQMRAPTPRWPMRENVRVDMPTTTANGSSMRQPRPFGSSSSSGIPPTMLRYPTMSLPMQNPYPTMTPHPYSTMTPPHPYPTITPSQPHPYPTMTPSQRPAFSAMPPPIQNSYPAMIQPVPNSLPATPRHAAQGQHLVMGGILSPPRSRNRFNPATRNSPQVCVPAEPSQSVVVAGQEPLTRSMLSDAPPQEQKQMLGERLFPQINSMYPELAGKITGMLLEIDNVELLHMLDSREALKAKVEEAVAVLQAHQARESV